MNQCVIIGAPRSGTNMLRDVLTGLPGFTTWPCDEINPIWRHGNRAAPSDELSPEMAGPAVQRYLNRAFERVARRHRATTVVEKTCANSLRVEFVAKAVPDAKFLFIRRDGIDSAASAMSRWEAPLDARYTAAKARFVPPQDVPYYGLQFLKRRARTRKSAASLQSSQVKSWWGPKPHDFKVLQRAHPIDELCMIQWQRCVEASLRGFSTLEAGRVHEIAYEEFVQNPQDELKGILDFLGAGDVFTPESVVDVSVGSVGKGRLALGEEATSRLESLAEETLQRFGYA